MPTNETKIQTQIATSTGVTVAASLMLAISSAAMLTSWGMMALVAGQQMQKKTFHVAVDAAPPLFEKLWDYNFINPYPDLPSFTKLTVGDIDPEKGMEIINSSFQSKGGSDIYSFLFVSSMGNKIADNYQYTIKSPFEMEAPEIVDWNNDEANELLFMHYKSNLELTDPHGTVLRQEDNVAFGIDNPIAVADLNHDGFKDFITAFGGSQKEKIVAYSGKNAGILWEYNIGKNHRRYFPGCTSAPISPNLDKDGRNDIVFSSCDCLTAENIPETPVDWIPNGENLDLIPAAASDYSFSLEDLSMWGINFVKALEIGKDNVVSINGKDLCGTAVFRLDDTGKLVWRKFISDQAQKYANGGSRNYFAYLTSAADFDGDGILEIPVTTAVSGSKSQLLLLNSDGSIRWVVANPDRLPTGLLAIGNTIKNPLVNKYDPPEILLCTWAPSESKYHAEVIDSHGSIEQEMPMGACIWDYTRLADINNDNLLDIVSRDIPSGLPYPRGTNELTFFSGSGTLLGQYVAPTGFGFKEVGPIADIDGNGKLDMVNFLYDTTVIDPLQLKNLAITFPQSKVKNYNIAWGMYRHDLHRTDWYEYNDPSAFPASPPSDATFRRGDADVSKVIDISDVVFTLQALFQAGPRWQCNDAADTNDDGKVDLSDAVSLLNYMYQGGIEPPFPGPVTPGADLTADSLDCVFYPS